MQILFKLKNAFVKVYNSKINILITFLVFILMYLITIYILNSEFIDFTITAGIFTRTEKIKLLYSTLTSVFTAIPTYSQIFLFITAALAGINVSYFVYYVKRRVSKQKNAGLGIVGIVMGFFGIGCSACGSVLLSTIFGLTASTQIIRILPFNGIEFAVFGVLIIFGSIIYITKKIEDPNICPIKIR